MTGPKGSARVRIDYENGILAASFDGCGMNDAITLMEAAKLKFLLQSMGGHSHRTLRAAKRCYRRHHQDEWELKELK